MTDSSPSFTGFCPTQNKRCMKTRLITASFVDKALLRCDAERAPLMFLLLTTAVSFLSEPETLRMSPVIKEMSCWSKPTRPFPRPALSSVLEQLLKVAGREAGVRSSDHCDGKRSEQLRGRAVKSRCEFSRCCGASAGCAGLERSPSPRQTLFRASCRLWQLMCSRLLDLLSLKTFAKG